MNKTRKILPMVAVAASFLLIGFSCKTTEKVSDTKDQKYIVNVYEALKGDLTNMGATVELIKDGVRVTFPNTILFELGKADVLETAIPIIKKMSRILAKYKKVNLEIIGHTDNTGDRLYNLELSKKRAENTKSIFGQKGIALDRISTSGLGMDRPIADNNSAEGRKKNRRVEFILKHIDAK